MKIYTKTGDGGKTGLLGGTRVSKAHVRIEAYGSVDELNAWMGVLAGYANGDRLALLRQVQHCLFTMGSVLAADGSKPGLKIPHIIPADTEALEQAIDTMDGNLPPLRAFVLPGGEAGSWAHVARTVCRRAERAVVTLAEQEEIEEIVLVYLNRLSDFLFVLSRAFVHEAGEQEVEWHPRG